jgi:mannose-6-phosphate isomerase-like protein (cupin superfamily)
LILDYSKIQYEDFEHFKGGEGTMKAKMFFDGSNRIIRAVLPPGASIGLHEHTINSEIIYILRGSGKIITDGEEEPISSDMSHYCPKGSCHSLINDSDRDLEFIGVVPNQ